jgi:SAM-dependent methyltransferase
MLKHFVIHHFVNFLLRLHNKVYVLLGMFTKDLEPDGLHPKHRIVKYNQFFIDQVTSLDVVLDIGCGKGSLARALAPHVKHIVAIEMEANVIQQARSRTKEGLIEFVHGDACSYDFGRTFDVIVMSNVLEHIEKREEFLRKVSRLAPRFLIRVPLLDRDWVTPYKKERGIEYRLSKTHFTEYTKKQFHQEIQSAGLCVESLTIQFGEIWAVVVPVGVRL